MFSQNICVIICCVTITKLTL